MECHRLLKNIKKYPGIISFLIVALFLTVSFAVIGVKPFGNRLILLGDSYNQYLPFFGLYKDKALSGSNALNDLFYSNSPLLNKYNLKYILMILKHFHQLIYNLFY